MSPGDKCEHLFLFCFYSCIHCFLLQLYSSKEWCQFLMGIWVWLRSVNVWSTLFISAFHLQTLKRVAPMIWNPHGPRGAPKTLLLSLALIWLLNFIYSIPAHMFSTSGDVNTTEVISMFFYFSTHLLRIMYILHDRW